MKWLFGCVLGCVPVLTFALIRIGSGGGAFDVNYAQSDTGGMILFYLSRLWVQPLDVLMRTGLALGVFWVIVGNAKGNTQRTLCWGYLPLILLATFMFSSRITRVIGAPLAPIVIPIFLMWIEGKTALNRPTVILNDDGTVTAPEAPPS